MHLKQITLTNFRCFDSLTVDLHERLTVLVAENAGGKTSVLDAIAKGLSAWNLHYSSADQRLQTLPFDDDDLHVTLQTNRGGKEIARSADFSVVFLCAADGSEQLAWDVSHNRTPESSPLNLLGTEKIRSRVIAIREAIHDGDEEIVVPLFAYYNVHRGHANQEVKDRTHPPKINYSQRLAALVDSLAPDLRDFSEIVSWFKTAALDELTWEKENTGENRVPGASDVFPGALPHLRSAFSAVLGERVSNPRWDRVKGMVVDFKDECDRPIPLSFEQLSQGYASMLALVFDLTQRLTVANPYFDAATEHDYRDGVDKIVDPLSAPAVVLIDEVDLHLHPSWQQRVLCDLQRAFPGAQFIVTTHSPQVLTTVKSENIRVLGRNLAGSWEALPPPQEIKGVESAVALNNVMGVNPVPPVDEAKWLADYIAHVENGTHTTPRAVALHGKLIALYGPAHPVMLDVDRLARFQAFKLRKGTLPQV